MKNFTPSFVALTVAFTLYAAQSSAVTRLPNYDNNQQCLIGIPIDNRPVQTGDINSLPIDTEANQFEVVYPNTAVYQGNVDIEQGNRSIHAAKATIDSNDKNNKLIQLEGPFTYQDTLIKINGNDAEMNLNTNKVDSGKSQYHLVNRLGRGDADKMELNENRYVILKNGSFTSCPINDNSWNIEGTTIIHDNKEQLLEVWNAIFRIGKVPVLYSPYLQLPTGNQRRSGLLIPALNYDSKDGVNFTLPVYFNIAPNYDDTFTPNFIEKRGVQFQNDFRYLNAIGNGNVAFDWLQHDKRYDKDRSIKLNGDNYDDNHHRWLFHWQNDGLINEYWRFNVNTSRVSDNQYLTDLNSKYVSETDGYLSQFYKVAYNNENWDINLSYRHFQSFYKQIRDNLYQIEPQLNMNYYNYNFGPFKFKTFAQISRFVTNGDNNPETWRYHVEPSLSHTLFNSWYTITSDASLMATHYNQNIPNHQQQFQYLDSSVNRYIPKFSIDGKIILERDTTSLEGYTQTLEPRVKYLYIPNRNQSSILNYDSSLLQSDYIGLFRDLPFSGLDRITSANKISTGATTRLYDNNKVERFNLSVGQITYFSESKTGDINSGLDKNRNTGSITWSADSFWRPLSDFIFRSGIQYDRRIDSISLANAIFEYRPSADKMLQLSYRYANERYIDAIGISNYNRYKQDISQVGTMGSWPITNTINIVGSYYYDTKLEQSADSFIGLHYSDCCWAFTAQYGRKIKGWEATNLPEGIRYNTKYENKFSINFEIQGLGRATNPIAKMLNYGKLPYITSFE